MENNELITVTVAFASLDAYFEVPITVPVGTTIAQAIVISGIVHDFPEINLNGVNRVGIFGKLRELSDEIRSGDRIEIYRPLSLSPLEARKVRAKQEKEWV
jgi:hypothetical protein